MDENDGWTDYKYLEIIIQEFMTTEFVNMTCST